MTGHLVPVSVPAAELVAANRVRGEHLLLLASGAMSLGDFFVAATDLLPLQRVGLRRVLTTSGLFGVVDAERAVRKMLLLLGEDVPLRKVTVGWVLDSRTFGRRLVVFADCVHLEPVVPVGFPFTPLR